MKILHNLFVYLIITLLSLAVSSKTVFAADVVCTPSTGAVASGSMFDQSLVYSNAARPAVNYTAATSPDLTVWPPVLFGSPAVAARNEVPATTGVCGKEVSQYRIFSGIACNFVLILN
ncbi:MAG: hypothetical protein ABL857_07195, partial [Rickettsiales bacterium]